MVKKIILGVLVAFFLVLSIMLYRQLSLLPPQAATGELDKAELARLTPPLFSKSSPGTPSPTTPSAAPSDISRKDVASPAFKIAERVQQLERQALGVPPPPQAAPPAQTAPQPNTAPQPPVPVAGEKNPPQGRHNALKELSVQIVGNDAHLRVSTEKQPERYTYFIAKAPDRVVIDLYGKFEAAKAVGKTPSNNLVGVIRTGLHADRLRIVADLLPNTSTTVQVTQLSPTELLIELKGK